MHAQRIDGLRLRNGILGESPDAIVRAWTSGRAERLGVEAAAASAVRGTGDVVATDVLGQRNVFVGGSADPFRRQLEAPHLRRAEMLEDARACTRRGAPIENAGGWQSARRVGPRTPPLRALAPRLIEHEDAVGHRETRVERDAPAGDDRPYAIVDAASVESFVESELEKRAQEI